MQSLSRTALRTARSTRRTNRPLTRQSLRHESHNAHDAHHHHPSQPVNESFGTGFYVALSTLPAAYLIHHLTTGGDSYLTRVIAEKYAEYGRTFAERNAVHVEAIEAAAADRVLFNNETNQGVVRWVDQRFPEKLDAGAPWNVPAGHGGNIEAVVAKFRKEAYEDNERKHQRLREGKVPCEQPFDRLAVRKPSTSDE